jgi:predicted nuclease of restriction endonuclease-like (RecB) superfamily
VLLTQIETRLHERAGKALTNFKGTLAPPHSDLAQQALKDPYVFDFLTLGPDAQERDLERGLLEHLGDFLLELGVGFAFVGSQVHLELGGVFPGGQPRPGDGSGPLPVGQNLRC